MSPAFRIGARELTVTGPEIPLSWIFTMLGLMFLLTGCAGSASRGPGTAMTPDQIDPAFPARDSLGKDTLPATAIADTVLPGPSPDSSGLTDSLAQAKVLKSRRDSVASRGQEEPLVMETADRMEGFRDRGEYILRGGVVFTHGELRLETEKAVWIREANLVLADSGMRITNRGSTLEARSGRYDKALSRATAEGDVVVRDSAGEFELIGRNLIYDRNTHVAQLFGNPVLKHFPESDTAAEADTLVIRGEVISYNDSLSVARAEGKVRITRGDLLIQSNRAEFFRARDSLLLTGEPRLNVGESEVAGKEMRVRLTGKEIRSLRVRGDAEAGSLEKGAAGIPARQSRVWGDSLFMAFKKEAPDSVEVFSNAKGNYYDVDRPEYINEMTGGYMVLRFGEKRISSADVVGGAKSVYYHFDEDALKGRNSAEGDTIHFTFVEGKIDEVEVIGKAVGRYLAKEADGPGAREPSRKESEESAPD